MQNLDFIIDLHCHSTYKPIGASYLGNRGIQSKSPSHKSSMWHYDPPSLFDKVLNQLLSVTKFSQTNFSAASYGQVLVVTVALGSIEKWFLNNGLGTGNITDGLENFLVELGKPRIDAIQNSTNYFADLMEEISFLKQMSGTQVKIDGKPFKYKVVTNFADLQKTMEENEATIELTENGANNAALTIAVIPSIEGMHVLNCGLINSQDTIGNPPNIEEVLNNARLLKEMEYKPFFVTFSHHFYNQLCGHSESLGFPASTFCNQKNGLRTSFTNAGKQVLDILLDNSNGKRILIDIKHLSPEGRIDFFKIRTESYPDIPIIISHGACNGLPSFGKKVSNYPKLGETFFGSEINFYDEEILLVEESKGIMGLQLDERRLANKKAIRETKNSFFRNKIMHYRSKLLWNQIQYVAELLDANQKYAWGTLAIGSDYDGIVDPLNSFWTMEQYPALKSFIERHAYNYLEKPNKLTMPFNKIDADTVVQNIFQMNAWNFLKTHF